MILRWMILIVSIFTLAIAGNVLASDEASVVGDSNGGEVIYNHADGYLYYSIEDVSFEIINKPIRFADVIFYYSDGSTPITARTDDVGFFTSSHTSTPDYIQVFSHNSVQPYWVEVGEKTWIQTITPYSINLDWISSDYTYTVDHTTSETMAYAFFIMDTIITGLEWLESESDTGWTIDNDIDISFPDDECDLVSCYDYLFNNIQIHPDDKGNSEAIWHELGHNLMDNVDAGPSCTEDHAFLKEMSTEGCGWAEGWADFFSAAVAGTANGAHNLYSRQDSNLEYNHFERYDHASKDVNGDGEFWDGAYLESSVASIIWDIFDNADTPDNPDNTPDGIDLTGAEDFFSTPAITSNDPSFPELFFLDEIQGFGRIWTTILDKPQTVEGFITSYINRYPGFAHEIEAIGYSHGLLQYKGESPTVTSTFPETGTSADSRPVYSGTITASVSIDDDDSGDINLRIEYVSAGVGETSVPNDIGSYYCPLVESCPDIYSDYWHLGTRMEDLASGSHSITLDTTSIPDGSYHLRVVVDDDKQERWNYYPYVLIDNTVPNTPVSLVGTTGWSEFPSFSWTDDGDAGSGIAYFEWKIGNGGTIHVEPSTSVSPTVAQLSSLADGIYTFYVAAVDNAGLTSNFATVLFYYDGSAPLAPASISVSPDGWTSVASWIVGVTLPTDSGSPLEACYKIGSVPTGPTQGTCSNAMVKAITSGVSQGSNSIHLWLRDALNHEGWNSILTQNLFFDSITPGSVSGVAATPSGWTSTMAWSIDWNNPTDSGSPLSFCYKLDVAPSSAGEGTCSGAKPLVLNSGISEGSHNIYVWVEDEAGNEGWSGHRSTTVKYDATVPVAPISVSTNPSGWSNVASWSIDWTYPADVGSPLQGCYSLDVAPTGPGQGFCPGTKPFIINSGITEGSHIVYTWLLDDADNEGWTNRLTTAIQFDQTPPTGILLLDSGAPETGSTDVNVYINVQDANPGTEARASNTNSFTGPFTASPFDVQWTIPSGTGMRTVSVQIRDAAGNLAVRSASILLDQTDPVGSISVTDLGQSYATDSTVDLSYWTSDFDTSVTSVEFSNDQNSWTSVNVAAGFYGGWILSGSTPGSYEVFMKITDAVGNFQIYSDTIWLVNSFVVVNQFPSHMHVAGTITLSVVASIDMLHVDFYVVHSPPSFGEPCNQDFYFTYIDRVNSAPFSLSFDTDSVYGSGTLFAVCAKGRAIDGELVQDSSNYFATVDNTPPPFPNIRSSTHTEATWEIPGTPIVFWEPDPQDHIFHSQFKVTHIVTGTVAYSAHISDWVVSLPSLSDGRYLVEARYRNEVGVWSNWDSFLLFIGPTPTVPDPPDFFTLYRWDGPPLVQIACLGYIGIDAEWSASDLAAYYELWSPQGLIATTPGTTAQVFGYVFGVYPDPEPIVHNFFVIAYNAAGQTSGYVTDFFVTQTNSGSCGQSTSPYVFTWNGTDFERDNNILPFAEDFSRDDLAIGDMLILDNTIIEENGTYDISILEFEGDVTFLDQLSLYVIDSDEHLLYGVTNEGDIIAFQTWSSPFFAFNHFDGEEVTSEIVRRDGDLTDGETFVLGMRFDYDDLRNERTELELRFDVENVTDDLALLIRADCKPGVCGGGDGVDPPPTPCWAIIPLTCTVNIEGRPGFETLSTFAFGTIEVSYLDVSGEFILFEEIAPRAAWSDHVVDISMIVDSLLVSGTRPTWSFQLTWNAIHAVDMVGIIHTNTTGFQVTELAMVDAEIFEGLISVGHGLDNLVQDDGYVVRIEDLMSFEMRFAAIPSLETYRTFAVGSSGYYNVRNHVEVVDEILVEFRVLGGSSSMTVTMDKYDPFGLLIETRSRKVGSGIDFHEVYLQLNSDEELVIHGIINSMTGFASGIIRVTNRGTGEVMTSRISALYEIQGFYIDGFSSIRSLTYEMDTGMFIGRSGVDIEFNLTGELPGIPFSTAKFHWDFGDGQVADFAGDPSVTHAYTSAGVYQLSSSIQYRVSGIQFEIKVFYRIAIDNLAPNASLSSSQGTASRREIVFFDASASSDPESGPLRYRFIGPDGTTQGWTTESSAEFTFTELGIYSVAVEVQDIVGAISIAQTSVEIVNLVPISEVRVTQEVGMTIRLIGPTDASVSMVLLEDGSGIASGTFLTSIPNHPLLGIVFDYAHDSVYRVTIDGQWSDMGNQPIIILFSWTSGPGEAISRVVLTRQQSSTTIDVSDEIRMVSQRNPTFTFDASGSIDPDGSIVSYSWDFGEGQVANGISVEYTFTTHGTHLVSLTVQDDDGATATIETTVDVRIPGNPTQRQVLGIGLPRNIIGDDLIKITSFNLATPRVTEPIR